MKKIIILIALTISAFGCATGQYDPRAGDCKKSGAILFTNTNIFNSYDAAYDHCIEKRSYESRLKNDPDFAKSESLRFAKEEQQEKDRLVKEKQLELEKKKAQSFGTSLERFLSLYGEPNTDELMNGAKVLWYDDKEKPFFAIFKNDKLASFVIDRETIVSRERKSENQETERRHQENLDEQRRARVASAIANSFKPVQQQPYMMPVNKPTTTNCNRIGNTVNCTSY